MICIYAKFHIWIDICQYFWDRAMPEFNHFVLTKLTKYLQSTLSVSYFLKPNWDFGLLNLIFLCLNKNLTVLPVNKTL